MLKLASQMDNDTRVKCMLAGWMAVDENCGELKPDSRPIRIWKSNGRRKSGRPTKYYLCGITINAIVIEAYNDEAALVEANERIV
jgi:hypothetical protein